MKNGLLTNCTILALTCVARLRGNWHRQKTPFKPVASAIIVNRLWSFSGAGRLSWKFSVDNGPDLIVRNGTYLGLDVALGDHVLDHKHEFFFGSDPQTVHVKAGETVYFQYVGAASLVFEVAEDQAQAARMVSKMRSVEEALAHSRH